MFERQNDLTALVTMLNDHWIFDKQSLQVTRLVNLRNKLTLSNLATLIDQEGHDSLGYEVANVLLHDAEVAVNQVLNHSGLHDDSSALLVFTGAHRLRHLVQDHFREEGSTVRHVATQHGTTVVAR